MFATLGEIIFELLSSPDALESSYRWNYAEQHVVEGVSRLQWVGDSLPTIAIAMMFHASFTDPGAQTAQLIAAASDHMARALVFGNGDHRGYFVVTSVRVLSRQMASDGSPIAIALQAELKQWPLEAAIRSALLPGFAPIGIVPAAQSVLSGPVLFSPPAGIPSTPAASTASYSPPPLASPGVSPMLYNPSPEGAVPQGILAPDILPASIVRRGA